MQYPLNEKIGEPALFVGREKEFNSFNKWLGNIPKRLSKSRVIIARRKSGKTAFVQRIFNQLWSDNGAVIPFYFEFGENKMWYPNLAIKYYRIFASQYIAFLTRTQKLVKHPLSLEQIREFGVSEAITPLIDDVDFLIQNKKVGGSHDLMWDLACSAPHRFADLYDQRFLVILDEFQYITQYIYPDQHYKTAPIDTLAGSYHHLSESKIAPMLVTGSYADLLLKIMSKYLEAGRLKQIRFYPYLTKDEGLQAVYQYAQFYEEPITNETAWQINELCMADPFFISCVILNESEGKDLTTSEGVINAVNYEISAKTAEMSQNWAIYIELTVAQVNNLNAKQILLYLSKHNSRYFTPQKLKEELHLELEPNDIYRQLLILKEADLITQGVADIDFRGLEDGTLNLVLRNRFEKEIKTAAPNLKTEFAEEIAKLTHKNRQLQGKLNHYAGKFAEHILATAFRSRKRFALSKFFQNVLDTTPLNLQKVKERVVIQREDGKAMEIDIVAESVCGRVVLVEVKKTQTPIGLTLVEDFQEKVEVYQSHFPDAMVLPAYFSYGGFVDKAHDFCVEHGIGMAEEILEW
ncbi:hypothetical protein PN36_19240 [Candidatus Thiomargarita nelsonii]|uniref:ATPase domain protein, prokaryote domain protein n=1 Tax=Candidatus Thiomargarita nelsonii TaxID=1003181 RepID=A0A4E0RRJ2_9GAMM|nr:hypothetical protein PN36_19240 [Candidatus Thiomargarita nelsonii]